MDIKKNSIKIIDMIEADALITFVPYKKPFSQRGSKFQG
jgi:hypothetical protein